MTIADRILELVEKVPGLTEREIANRLFGGNAPQQRVNQDCRLLVGRGQLVRSGKGGIADPFTYSIGKR